MPKAIEIIDLKSKRKVLVNLECIAYITTGYEDVKKNIFHLLYLIDFQTLFTISDEDYERIKHAMNACDDSTCPYLQDVRKEIIEFDEALRKQNNKEKEGIIEEKNKEPV